LTSKKIKVKGEKGWEEIRTSKAKEMKKEKKNKECKRR